MEKGRITDEMRDKFRAPFPNEAYSKHPTKSFLTTLKAMYVTERLNDVLGLGRWTIDIEVIERTNDYVLVQGEFRSLDYDIIIPKQFGGHKTSGTNTEIADGFKSAITDCQSKIASYLEIGIDMFKGKIDPKKLPKKPESKQPESKQPTIGEALRDIKNTGTEADLKAVWTKYKIFQTDERFKAEKDKLKQILAK